MQELLRAAVEYNAGGAMVWSLDDPGAFARGKTPAAALLKLPEEVARFRLWSGKTGFQHASVSVVQECLTGLRVSDADSDIIFENEKMPMTSAEYEAVKALVIRSAQDFEKLYCSLPDRETTDIPQRETFYSGLPRTGREMYEHTNCVTSYYLGEIGLEWKNLANLAENRMRALEALERLPGFLNRPASVGSYGEWWSLRKAMRRFLWHDRIHGRAMYRMAVRIWGGADDVFCTANPAVRSD